MVEAGHPFESEVVFLYTNIGRGHPTYLDGIIETLETRYPHFAYRVTDVFSVSRGVSLLGWKLVRGLYRIGGRGGVVTAFYSLLRRITGAGEGEGILHRILGRDIKEAFKDFPGTIVVAHPIVARILSRQNQVIYQHGELAAPDEAVVEDCRQILVPRSQTAAVFRRAGIPGDRMTVTGQCIEPSLATQAESAFARRLERLSGQQPLTAALFSSGAYPAEHLRRLFLATVSLARAGHTVYLFLGASEKVCDRFAREAGREGIETTREIDGAAPVRIVHSPTRRDENRSVAGVFESLDIFVAPAHERTNWSVGLGIPQFTVCPHIGSYAPLNAAIADECGVACELRDDAAARRISETIAALRGDGGLVSMARCGFSLTEINGFDRCVDFLVHEAEIV